MIEDDILSELQWELGDDEPDIHDDWLLDASPMRRVLIGKGPLATTLDGKGGA